MERRRELAAKIQPFDSFWEAPDDIERGYERFGRLYRHNYLKHLPEDRAARILCVSCGPGYLVQLLRDEGYRCVRGIDSMAEKVRYATGRGLDCEVAYAFDYLESASESFDVIFCEQELNHLTREEILDFLALCRLRLAPGGTLVCWALNGANPITGAEALAQNFDHFNTFTEYSMRQLLAHAGFREVDVFGIDIYVYYANPLNYVAMGVAGALSLLFRACYILYGKKTRIFTKKLAAVARVGDV